MQDKVRNKLTKRQYENEVSWSTSTWLALQAQRLSVAVHIASAWEIATEMQLAVALGARRPRSLIVLTQKVRTQNRVRVAQPYT